MMEIEIFQNPTMAAAYEAIKARMPEGLTVKGVARSVGIDTSRAYYPVSRLEKAGFITGDDSRPRRYFINA